MGEKPLVTICGRPMLRYVIDAFECAGCEVVVVISSKTPYIRNWCTAQGVVYYQAAGSGYVADIVEAVEELEEKGPVFISVADLPCLTPTIVDRVRASYQACGKPACSAWIPERLCRAFDCRAEYRETVQGVCACPAGINILTGSIIAGPQEEARFLLEEPRLAFNVNTREELAAVQRFLCGNGTR
jgi:adenosylcobinamide-phosphate guanylyltransferase